MQLRCQLTRLQDRLRRSRGTGNHGTRASRVQIARVVALVGLASLPGWSAVGSAIPFVAPITSLNTGVQAVVYACSCIGGMAGFIAAWKHEHSWSGIGAKALEYGSIGAMCIGFPLFLTAIIPGAAGAVI
jgi:hypothetical protein